MYVLTLIAVNLSAHFPDGEIEIQNYLATIHRSHRWIAYQLFKAAATLWEGSIYYKDNY